VGRLPLAGQLSSATAAVSSRRRRALSLRDPSTSGEATVASHDRAVGNTLRRHCSGGLTRYRRRRFHRPLLLALPVTGALFAAAFALSGRHDVGAGLRAPRPGSANASNTLATPLGFALRLHRANLIGWVAGLFVLGTMYSSVLGDAEQLLTARRLPPHRLNPVSVHPGGKRVA
jgi:hypothetical protein